MLKLPKHPIFYPTLAHTDNLAYFDSNDERIRMSSTRIWPKDIRKNVLMNLSFDPKIHYSTTKNSGDPDGLKFIDEDDEWNPPENLFVDCGAIQYIGEKIPILNGIKVTAENVWKQYMESHIVGKEWNQILVCSPDHIVIPDHSKIEARRRLKITRDFALEFIKIVDTNKATPVAVIHGQSPAQRKWQLDYFIRIGYRHFAFGGAVPLSTDKPRLLELLAGIEDIDDPIIKRNSVLGRVKELGYPIHMFGPNSPDWYRWWCRLGISSFDGSKVTNEGAANGWYWDIPDSVNPMIARGEIPNNVMGLYTRTAVKKFQLSKNKNNWKVSNSENNRKMLRPVGKSLPECDCSACRYLRNARCTSNRCTTGLEGAHSADPRSMGSTEHNHGRVAHNAHIYSQLIELINEIIMDASEKPNNDWAKNWSKVPTE